jgi:hypothetical protein
LAISCASWARAALSQKMAGWPEARARVEAARLRFCFRARENLHGLLFMKSSRNCNFPHLINTRFQRAAAFDDSAASIGALV